MNIAYILHSTTPADGATKSFLVTLRGLMDMGVKPVIVAPDQRGIYGELKKMGIPVLATTYRLYTYPRGNTLSQKLLFLPRLLARLATNHMATRATIGFLRKHPIDIIHTNAGLVNIGFRAARKLGKPHIFHLREYGKLDFGYNYFPSISHFYKQLDDAPQSFSICITRGIQRYHHQNEKASSRVIYNGICSQVHELPVQDKGHNDYFLYAGRLEPTKGIDTLLEAYLLYARNISEPLPLRIAGRTTSIDFMRKLQQFVAEHNLQDLVSFLGERRDITELMKNARAIVIPSLHEGFGRCMPEAILQGCLAIGRNTDGTKEQFDNGLDMTGEEIGLRYDTNEELSRLLKEVTVNPISYYQPYKERAFRVVNQLYTEENNIQQIYSFYKEILKDT